MAELLTDIDGLPVLVRLLIRDMPADLQSEFVSKGNDIHSLLLSTLENMIGRMRGSFPQNDAPSKPPLAMVELISSRDSSTRLPALPNETVLRVGPLELDLLDRTAKRGDRKIDLRPREFQLLKYMMQRSDKLLSRATLLKEVWRYRFVPETNLVDVHMGRLSQGRLVKRIPHDPQRPRPWLHSRCNPLFARFTVEACPTIRKPGRRKSISPVG
jgi:hypothetical protein